MKIRIFALAKEMGLDSKVLIEYCNRAGIHLKNSALASITPEERDLVVKFIQEDEQQQDDQKEGLTPERERLAEERKEMRQIKSAPARTQQAKHAADDEDAGVATTSTQSATAVEEAPVDQQQDVAPAAGQDQAGPTDTPGDDEADPSDTTGETDEKVTPITRDDYVPTSRAASSQPLREMKPRGTVSGMESRGSTSSSPKPKPKPALPNVAAPPTYKQPKTPAKKQPDQQAQKPDMKLTPEILEQQSPLAGHLRKHAEQKKHRKPGDETDLKEESRRGSLIESRKREKNKLSRQHKEDEVTQTRTRPPRRRRQKSSGPVELKSHAQIELPITLRGLSEAMGRPAKSLMQILWKDGNMVTINEILDEETALELAMELGVELEIKRGRDLEAELAERLEYTGSSEDQAERPPIITILGHVDHGKTTLLDKLREANVASGEAGGITQHIASYQVEHNGQKLTFVDTPGHAAFGEMRARGANVTDIIVLVVAADDGVMPQTVECISHARAAGVPIVVALNKIDLPDTNEQKVLQELAAQEILPSEWGGEIDVVRTSGETGEGLDELLETLLLTAELHEYKGNPNVPAHGVCLEAFRDEGRGVIAWLIVQQGTLKVGDDILCGSTFGRVRAIYNDRNEAVDTALPSTPVKVSGLANIPGAGEHFFVMSDPEESRNVAEDRIHKGRTEVLSRRGQPRKLEDILNAARAGEIQDLPLIIKADSPGSIEALRSEINKLEHEEVRVIIVHEGVGGVNESDVYLASASGAIIVAFHVIPEDKAQLLAEQEGVEIRRYNVIYDVTEQIKQALEGLLLPEKVEVATGRALVLQTFHISRFGTIAGCRILSGSIERSNRVHVIRDQKVLNSYSIASLKREKDDVKEVREGMECGIRLDGFNDVKEGDLLEAYRVDEIKRTFD